MRRVLKGLLAGVVWLTVAVPLLAQEWDAKSTAEAEWVVFSSGRSGGGDIYAVQPASGKTILLAGSPLPESSVRYDSSRDRIVFSRYDGEQAVVVSAGQELFADPSGDVSPAWSPDGWRVAYSARRNGQEDLFVARPDGSRERRLTDDPEPDRYPAWSPDGARIAFARRDEAGWDLFSIDLSDPEQQLTRLTERGDYVGHPAWSPDGRLIAFDMRVEDDTEIAVLDIESLEISVVTDRAGNDLIPAWSLDGRRLAFGGRADSTGNWDIWSVDLESGAVNQLTDHVDFDGGPVVVPPSAIERESGRGRESTPR